MTNYRVHRKQYLDALFETVKGFKGDFEISSSLARYLCVLVAGFLETSIREILIDHAQKTSSVNVVTFVSNRLEHMRSPYMDNILDLLGSFSEDWKKAVKDAVRKADLGQHIDAIAKDRNEIVHGAQLDITYGQISSYYEKAVELVSIIERECC